MEPNFNFNVLFFNKNVHWITDGNEIVITKLREFYLGLNLVIKGDKFYIYQLVMKKIYSILFALILILLIGGCSHSTKIISPRQKTPEVSLKARDLYLKGLFYQSEGLYNEALVQFYQALHHDSSSSTIYNSIAENHIKLGHFESALILLKKAELKNPYDPETLDLMADCYFRLRDDENAIETYKKILKLNPYQASAREHLLFLYKKLGNEKGIAEQYEQLDEYYGHDSQTLNDLAEIYFKYKEYDKAINAYSRIVQKDSLNFQAYYKMGNVYKTKGMIEEAKDAFQKALAIRPDYYPAIQDLALLYGNEQKWQEVIDVFEDGRYQIDSTQIFPLIMVAQSYYYLKEYDKARDKLLPVIQKDDAPLDFYEMIARVEFETRNYDQAKRYWQYLLKKDENNKIASLYLGTLFLETENPDSAVIVYEKALKAHPDDPTILGFYGSALQQQGQFEQALPYLSRAHELNPDNINVISSLTVVYESLGRFEKSDSLYEAALNKFPDNALLLNNFSYSLSERDIRLDEALEMIKKALTIVPDNGAYLDTIGWIYYKLKNYPEAEKYIKQAIEVRENSAVVFEHLGDVYYELQQFDLARDNWKKALDIQPSNENLKLKLEKVK